MEADVRFAPNDDVRDIATSTVDYLNAMTFSPGVPRKGNEMGLNNYVRVNARPNASWIQYKWGFVREIDYAIGDKISWEGLQRPPEADGIVRVSGVAIRSFDENKVILHQGDYERFFFEIVFNNDRIEGVREISEEEYDRLEAEGR